MTETLTPLQQKVVDTGSAVKALSNNLASRYPSPPPAPPPPVKPGSTGMTSATDASGNRVFIGDPSLNPGLNYGGAAPATTVTETPLEKATREYYEGLNRTVDPEAIRENVRKNMQGQVDATNALYDNLVAGDTKAGDALNARVRGININSGLGGSDFATANATGQEEANAKVIESRNRERAAALSTILGNIDTRATQEVKDQTAIADKNSQNYLSYLKDNQDKAQADLKSTAGMGITYDQFKTQNPAMLTKLLTQTGLNEVQAKALFIANAPQGTYLNADKPEIVGNSAIFFKQVKDPVTGKVSISQDTVELPAGTNKDVQIITRDDGIYIINKIANKDGTFTTTKVGAPNPPKAPATAKITISEAKAAGLPLSVVGQSEQDIVTSLADTKMPQWFIDKSKSESITPTQQVWDEYRKNLSGTFGESDSTKPPWAK